MSIPDFITGIYRDGPQYPCSFYSFEKKFPRLIVKRDNNPIKYKAKNPHVGKSAFQQVLEMIQLYHDYLTDDIITVLSDAEICKYKCSISYPLFKAIPDDISDEDILNYFQKETLVKNKNRYWKKVILIHNKRYLITNHIFHTSVTKLLNFLVELTGIVFENNTEYTDTRNNVEKFMDSINQSQANDNDLDEEDLNEEDNLDDDLNENNLDEINSTETYRNIFDEEAYEQDLITHMKDILTDAKQHANDRFYIRSLIQNNPDYESLISIVASTYRDAVNKTLKNNTQSKVASPIQQSKTQTTSSANIQSAMKPVNLSSNMDINQLMKASFGINL